MTTDRERLSARNLPDGLLIRSAETRRLVFESAVTVRADGADVVVEKQAYSGGKPYDARPGRVVTMTPDEAEAFAQLLLGAAAAARGGAGA